jgi:hypothetical protein
MLGRSYYAEGPIVDVTGRLYLGQGVHARPAGLSGMPDARLRQLQERRDTGQAGIPIQASPQLRRGRWIGAGYGCRIEGGGSEDPPRWPRPDILVIAVKCFPSDLSCPAVTAVSSSATWLVRRDGGACRVGCDEDHNDTWSVRSTGIILQIV